MKTASHKTFHPAARFWDRIAQKYARKPVPDQHAYATKLAKTDSYLKVTDKVLEIGCGTGTTAIHHAPKVDAIYAIDISPKMIDIATTKAAAAQIHNIYFEVGNLDLIKNHTQRFDVIMAHSLLHLLPDPAAALEQIRMLLKPGGLLISSTPCIRDFFPAFRFIGPVGRLFRLMPYVNVFSATEFYTWLEAAEFSTEFTWQPNAKNGIYMVCR